MQHMGLSRIIVCTDMNFGYSGSNLVTYDLNEKGKFSERFVANDLKVDRCRQFTELMKR